VVLTAAAALVGLLASPAAAAPGQPTPTPPPRTAAQAMDQLAQFNEQFETVTERYNDARVLLRARRAQAAAADRRARSAHARYTALAGQIRRIVSTSYRSAPFGQLTAMLTSGSPQEFIARSAALGLLARRRSGMLAAAGEARVAALGAQSRSHAAAAAVQRLTQDLARRKADLARRAAQSRTLFNRLSAAERQAFLERTGGSAADRASRTTTRAPVTVAASGRAKVAVDTALKQLGKPYVWAAAGPDSFDCSGLTLFAWAAAGVSLPHSSQMQLNVGLRVSRTELRPGDLVFFYSPIHHVGLYIGNGQMVHAPTFNDVVKISAIDGFPWSGATRPG